MQLQEQVMLYFDCNYTIRKEIYLKMIRVRLIEMGSPPKTLLS